MSSGGERTSDSRITTLISSEAPHHAQRKQRQPHLA
jgi:hypothetical protein